MKIAFKNFITTLRRYKMASVLNIAGMTLAFLAFYVIMSQVYYDVTYNRSIRDSDRTYILLSRHYDGWIPLESRINAEEALATWPEVECSGAIRKVGDGAEYVWVKRSEYNYDRYDYRTAAISLPLLDVLSFRTVEGDLRRLSEPETVIISESLAERMGVHAGDDVYLPDMDAKEDDPDAGRKPARRMTVAGVYADFAPNTMMGNVHMAMDAGDDLLSEDKRDWRAYTYYVKLREGASPEDMAEVWKRTIPYADDDSVMLVSVRDIYYWDALEFGGVEQGSKSGSAVLFGIAMLIVVVAFINFVNFFFAMIPVRLRAVNICKVFGAPTSALRWNFLFESVGMVLCSLLLALYLMVVVQESFLAEYVTCSLAMSDHSVGLVVVPGVVHHLVQCLVGRQERLRRLGGGAPYASDTYGCAVHHIDNSYNRVGGILDAVPLHDALRHGFRPRQPARIRVDGEHSRPRRRIHITSRGQFRHNGRYSRLARRDRSQRNVQLDGWRPPHRGEEVFCPVQFLRCDGHSFDRRRRVSTLVAEARRLLRREPPYCRADVA